MTMYYSYLESPIGKLLLVGESGALVRVEFEKHGRPVPPHPRRLALRDIDAAPQLGDLRPQRLELRRQLRPLGPPVRTRPRACQVRHPVFELAVLRWRHAAQ